MKSKLMRCFSLILICAILLPTIASAAPQDAVISADDVTSVEEVVNNKEWIDLSELNGEYMYFHSTDNWTIAINSFSNGKFEIVKNDKMTNHLAQGLFNIEDIGNAPTTLEDFTAIEHLVLTGAIILTNNLDSQLMQISTVITRSAETDKVEKTLENEYGKPYYNKFLASASGQGGYSGSLFETMTFTAYKHVSYFIDAGSTLAAVVSLMNLPAAVVLKIITFVGAGLSAATVYSDVTANKYVADANWDRVVQVKDIYPYRAGKTIYGYCYVGDKDAAYVYDHEKADFDFEDKWALIDTAIYNYIYHT